MKNKLLRGAVKTAGYAKSRPSEAKWSGAGVVVGILIGLIIGGVGIAALGGAVGMSSSFIFALLGGLIGNRYGMEIDRRRK